AGCGGGGVAPGGPPPAVPISCAAALYHEARAVPPAARRRVRGRYRRSRAGPLVVRGRRSPVGRRTAPLHGAVRLQAWPVPVIFHSLDFVVFFAVVVALYWRLPHRGQNVLLLVASYVFYGYVHPWFLILIASSTTIDYLSARGMERWPGRRRAFMALSLVTNFGMLGFFKY